MDYIICGLCNTMFVSSEGHKCQLELTPSQWKEYDSTCAYMARHNELPQLLDVQVYKYISFYPEGFERDVNQERYAQQMNAIQEAM